MLTAGPIRQPLEQRRYRALLIGVSAYQGADEVFTPLSGPKNDIIAMKRVLTSGPGALFVESDVTTVADPDLMALRDAIQFFLQSSTVNDTILLYYSGHGALEETRRENPGLYFCPRDVMKSTFPSRAMHSDEVSQWLDDCSASQKIAILDCCYAGGFKGSAVPEFADRLIGKGRFVMVAADRVPARDGPGISPFTELVVKGLEEPIDEQLSMTRLAEWVEEQAKTRPMPDPRHRSDVTGQLLIADRTRRNQTREQPKPAEVPVLTLTFSDRHVEAVLPDRPPLKSGPLALSGTGAHYMNILVELNRLAANEVLCRDKEARTMLDTALTSARSLAGQALFDDLFDDELREELFKVLRGGRKDPRLELRLDLTDAATDITRASWEYLGLAEAPRGAETQLADQPRLTGRIGEKLAVLTRGVTPAHPANAGWKGGTGPIGVLVHSEFTEDHPLLATIRTELASLAASPPATGPGIQNLRVMHAPDVRPGGNWDELVSPLGDPEINVLVMVGRLKDINDTAVLQINEQVELRGYQLDDLFEARLDAPPPELVILEAIPYPGVAEKGFGLTASFAQDLAKALGCPVIGVCHTGAYIASLPSPAGWSGPRSEPEASRGGPGTRLSTLTAHVIDGLRHGLAAERCAYKARQQISLARTPMAVPVVYLPNRSSAGEKSALAEQGAQS